MHLRLILLLTCIGLVLTGCSGPQPLPVAPTPIPTLIPATLPAVPMPALPSGGVLVARPPAAAGGGVTDAAVALGQQVFETNCKACHKLTDEKLVGPGLAGLFERMPQLPSGKPFSEENLIEWIKSGGKAMPSFASLPEEQINGVISYLKAVTAAEKKVEAAPTEGATAATAEIGAAQATDEPSLSESPTVEAVVAESTATE